MEKEKILSTMTEKLGKTSLSGRSIETYVNNNLPADGTEPDAAYFEKHVNVLKSFSGQYDHDFAAAVEDYKKKNAIAAPATNAAGTVATSKEIDDRYAALEAKIQALEEARAADVTKMSVEKLRSGVMGKAVELKISNYKNEWEDAVNSTNLSDCKTEDEALDKCKSAFERIVKRYHGDSAKPYGKGDTSPKHTDGESKKLREAYLEGLRKSGKIPTV